jgi:hypothetical protein
MVTTVYTRPTERVLFHEGRDANPIFHLMESVWMLAGRKDVAFLTQFNSRMGDFSDDGANFNAAYGHRWRNHFGRDQLTEVIRLLRRDHATRQAVIQIWDSADLAKNTKDKACNTQIVFDVRKGRLNMTVFNVAAATGHPVGVYRQVSNNLHLYTELYDATPYLLSPPVSEEYDHYSRGAVVPSPLMIDSDYERFLEECEAFCENPFDERTRYASPFFDYAARPMALVSRARKTQSGDGRYYAQQIRADDWRKAVFDWIDRREKRKLMKTMGKK